MTQHLPFLPPTSELETKAVLKQAAAAHRYLAELKAVSLSIPNEQILISTLTLQEAQDSSAIENIITTQDELFKAELYTGITLSPGTKEVQQYAIALRQGFETVRQVKIIRLQDILALQQELEKNNAGIRKLPGTVLKNNFGIVVYSPPQDYDTLFALMQNLVDYINNDELSEVDPLIKMAVIHHQFESIHPFYDGNGRTGRMLNILYLVIKDLLHLPILYLSRYIVANKSEYYRLLQHVRETGEWEAWLLYMLKGIEVTSRQSIALINEIKVEMQAFKIVIREKLPKIYSQELLNNLFRHPYTKIEFLASEIQVTRVTATRYLDALVGLGLLVKSQLWRSSYYFNQRLIDILMKNPKKRFY